MKNLTIGIVGSESVGKTTYCNVLGAKCNTGGGEIRRIFETNYGQIDVRFVETLDLMNVINQTDGIIFMCDMSDVSMLCIAKDIRSFKKKLIDNSAVIIINKCDSDVGEPIKTPKEFNGYDVSYSSAMNKENVFEPLVCLLNLIRLRIEIEIL